MRSNNWRTSAFLLFFRVTIFLYSLSVTDACSCLSFELAPNYNSNTDVMMVKILKRVNFPGESREEFDDMYIYLAVVQRVYKGCTKKNDFVVLKSYQSSATCGIQLRERRRMIVTVSDAERPGTFWVTSCGYNQKLRDVSREDWDWLRGRNSCCEDNCFCADGGRPVACYADPCKVDDKCEDKGARCVANYCDGCNAEWFNEIGQPVCTKCTTDDDCGNKQVCKSDGCRTACYNNNDCGRGYVCGDEGICTSEMPGKKLTYFRKCGPSPVCHGWKEKPGIDLCEKGIEVGQQCFDEKFQCDPVDGCNELVVCAATDPKPFGCLKSRRSTKRDINYLDNSARDKIASDLMSFQLATWNYKQEAASAEPRLGFIIDDVEPSPSVDGARDMVDIYGYLSMAVAALQNQQDQIEELRSEVDRLRSQSITSADPSGQHCAADPVEA